MLNLQSCLAQPIRNFIELRCLSGTDYKTQSQLLKMFDKFLVEHEVTQKRVTLDVTEQYKQTLLGLAPRTQYNRFSVVIQLCKYLATTDPLSYVPEPLKTISSSVHRPYIYTQEEIQALLTATTLLKPAKSLRPQTYHCLVGLLYCTGIRISEAIGLNLEHIHLDEHRLYIASGKFRKARWIPLQNSVTAVLEQYIQKRLSFCNSIADTPLFINLRYRRLNYITVQKCFQDLLSQCGVVCNDHFKPCIHSIRHSFAVHRLLKWYQEDKDVNALLPALATYMGHVNIHSTQIYLHPTKQLLEQVSGRFHNYYLNNIKGEHP